MDEYQRLIVGVELKPRVLEPSLGSRAALSQAGWLAARSGASILIVHSTWDGRDEAPLPGNANTLAALAGLVSECVDPAIQVTYEIEPERPWMAISRRARPTDLVLIGKRDIEVADGARVGPTAAKLVRACSSPVWLVEPSKDQVLRLVLAATDFSAVSQRAVDSAAWLAQAHSAELHVVHAWRMPRAVQDAAATMDHEEYVAIVEQHRLRALATFEQAVAGLPIDPTLHLERGRAADRILGRIEVLQPDLVLMGSLSVGSRPGHFVGETAERVLPRLDVSVLTFKPGDFPTPLR